MINRRELIGVAGGVALLSSISRVAAQQRPSTIKIICGYGAGGTTDLLCRHVAAKMSPGYAPSVIVENKTGAQAMISVAYVKQQPPDGSNILQAAFTTFSLFPVLYKNLRYEAADFVPLTAGCQAEYALAVGPMVPDSVRTIEDYVAWAKKDAKNVMFGAIGQLPTIVGLLLGKASNVELVPVQYRGGAPAAQDTLGGNIPSVVTTVGDIFPLLGDKLRLLATTGKKRNRLTPDVPTFAEQGIPDVVARNYFGFFTHAKTPSEIVESQSDAIRAALRQTDVIDALAKVALDPLPLDSKETAELVASDRAQWEAYVKRIDYQPAPI